LSNGKAVKLEQWIDQDASNTWHKVLEFIDNGDWGGGHPNCGGTDLLLDLLLHGEVQLQYLDGTI
jgi:hypothetical protein